MINPKKLLILTAAILLFSAQISAATLTESVVPAEICLSDSSSVQPQNTVLRVYVVENTIHLADVPDGSTLSLFSITGARLGTYTVHNNKVVLDRTLDRGIYIVRVNNRAAKITIR